jgi:heptosyltransferase-3
MMATLDLPAHPRILVIALRRLGDVLLATPLIRSLKRGYANARIDVLVFAGTEGILQGNPDVSNVIVIPARPSAARTLTLAAQLWRRYDLAVSTQSGDRPTFFAWVAGRRRAGPIEPTGIMARLKRQMLDRAVVALPDRHRVDNVLQLVDGLGIARASELVAPRGELRADLRPTGPYAVIHAAPMFRYKRWNTEGWRALAASLLQRGLSVVATGGPSPEDRAYLDDVWRGLAVCRVDGVLTWPELAEVIRAARVYIGPDTSVTHLAAAAGGQTIALYGPTDPRLWGPWPTGGLREPWAAADAIQRRNNVWIVQNPLPCLPCQLEGCERRLDSFSTCLDELPAQQVLVAVGQALSASS